MAITVRSSTALGAATRSNTSVAISSVQAGDIIVAILDAERTLPVTLPGYTDIDLDPDDTPPYLPHPINNWALRAYYAVATGAETAVTWSHGSSFTCACVVVFSGVDTSNVLDGIVKYVQNSTTQTVTIPGHTFTTNGAALVIGSTWDPYPSTTPPSGFTELMDLAPTNSTLYVCWRQYGPGATGNISLSMDADGTGDDRVAVLIPFRAAGGEEKEADAEASIELAVTATARKLAGSGASIGLGIDTPGGELDTAAKLAQAAATAGLELGAASTAEKAAAAAAALDIAVDLAAEIEKAIAASASLAVTIDVDALARVAGEILALVTLGLDVDAAAAKAVSASSAHTLEVTIAAAAVRRAVAAASLGLSVDLAGTVVAAHRAAAIVGLACDLAAGTVKRVSTSAALQLAVAVAAIIPGDGPIIVGPLTTASLDTPRTTAARDVPRTTEVVE